MAQNYQMELKAPDVPYVPNNQISQGSDTRVRTQKTRWFFLGKPTLKNPGKNPAQNKQILMSHSTVIKKF